jgi:hypothetical protein
MEECALGNRLTDGNAKPGLKTFEVKRQETLNAISVSPARGATYEGGRAAEVTSINSPD